MRKYILFILAPLLALSFATPASAYWGPGRYRPAYRPNYASWHGGHWYHGTYGGRLGWFWAVNGVMYSYTHPIYPYPQPAATVYVVQPSPPPAPVSTTMIEQPAPETMVTQASAQVPPTASPAAPTTYYYCATAPSGYYPYVQSCAGGWQTVPATPNQAMQTN